MNIESPKPAILERIYQIWQIAQKIKNVYAQKREYKCSCVARSFVLQLAMAARLAMVSHTTPMAVVLLLSVVVVVVQGYEWTWISGSNSSNAPASYGLRGTPGARDSACSFNAMVNNWTQGESDVLWLFGGEGLEATSLGNYCKHPHPRCRCRRDLLLYLSTPYCCVFAATMQPS